MSKILIIDDESGIRDALGQTLEAEGHDVRLAENGAQGRQARKEYDPDMVLLDIWMPDLDGLSLLKEWAAQGLLTLPVVMMSGNGTIQDAVEATRLGALAFLEKPIAFKLLIDTVEKALMHGRRQPDRPAHIVGLGDSETIEALEYHLRKAEDREAPIFLSAEPGSGAEACARFLHVPGTPWQAPDDMSMLAESPLSWLQIAKGGVLFLQDIDRLTKMQQRGLLLLMSRRKEFDVRVICTSAESLALKEGYSRELYNELTHAALRVPALRSHPEDIPQIARHLLSEICARQGLPAPDLDEAAMDILATQYWPGNIDELATTLEQLAVTAKNGKITGEEVERHLGVRAKEDSGMEAIFDMPYRESCTVFERIYAETLLKRCKYNFTRAAEVSALNRSHLHRIARKHGLKSDKNES